MHKGNAIHKCLMQPLRIWCNASNKRLYCELAWVYILVYACGYVCQWYTLRVVHAYGSTKKNPKEDPYPEILKRRTGEFIWINKTSSEQFRCIFNYPHFDKVRFTKMYFRELSHLKAIIVFESHLNILFNLPKQKIEDIIKE